MQKDKPIFVAFGDARIKLSNIKNYGVIKGDAYYQKTYRLVEDPSEFIIGRWVYTNNNFKIDIVKYQNIINEHYVKRLIYLKKGEKNTFSENELIATKDGVYEVDRKTPKEDAFSKEENYLYITTYQNDNFKYSQDDVTWDIKEKFKELDDYLCN